MKEATLRNFFIGTSNAGDLASEIVGTVEISRDVTRYHIEDMNKLFEVKPSHLVKLCDAVLDDTLNPEALEAVGFCLVASDHFEWDGLSVEGEIIDEIVLQWAAPEINYPLTLENVRKFRARLIEVPKPLK